MVLQTTVAAPFELAGVGLHTGHQARVRVSPAPADHGIQIGRSGRPAVRARVDAVTSTHLCTQLGSGDGRIATVEHLLAALAGVGVDNAAVTLVEGAEVPILDGSARPFVDAILGVGRAALSVPRRVAVVHRTVVVEGRGGAFARLEPALATSVAGRYLFRPPVGTQRVALGLTSSSFATELAPARTFGFEDEVHALHRAGRALGGSLANALVYGPGGPVNADGSRFADECARHKLLDAVGDLALFGAPWRGRYVADRAGHALNVALVIRALATPGVLRFERQPDPG